MSPLDTRPAAAQPDRAGRGACHPNRKAARSLGLALLLAAVPPAGSASAQDAMKVRPGFGYTIDFMSGVAAEALLPVSQEKTIVTRQGFGYTIDFTTGFAAEALLPVPKQEVETARPDSAKP